MSGGFGSGRAQPTQGQGPGNLWTGQSYTPWQQPRGQMPFMGGGFGGGGFYHQGGGFGGGRPSWPGFGYGGMPGRYGGGMGGPGMGMSAWGNPFSGFSGGYNPYGPGSYSSPGAMGYGGGSGMFGGGNYNMMAHQMAAVPYQQMARSRFSMPYRYANPAAEQATANLPRLPGFGTQQTGRPVNPMNPASGCFYDSSQDDYICPGQ